jgi:hypothetical protein
MQVPTLQLLPASWKETFRLCLTHTYINHRTHEMGMAMGMETEEQMIVLYHEPLLSSCQMMIPRMERRFLRGRRRRPLRR